MEGTPKKRNIPNKGDLGPKRFEIQSDTFIKERLNAVQSGVEKMKEENTNVIGLSLFGSMVKGNAHEGSDIDGYLYIDAEHLAQEEAELAAQENREPRPVTFDVVNIGNISTYPGEHLYDIYKPLIKEKFTEDGSLTEEQISDINVRPVSSEIIDRHLSLLQKGLELSKRDDTNVKIEASQNLCGLFHLAVGHGLDKYRQEIIEKLEGLGEDGESIWGNIIGQTEKLEQYMYTDTPIRYPRTLVEARAMYIHEKDTSNNIEIPPQFTGMTAEAVDIAWTVPVYVDADKTVAEIKRKKDVLTTLRESESQQKQKETPAKSNTIQKNGTEFVKETDSSDYEAFLEQPNVRAATKKINQLLTEATFRKDAASDAIYNLLTKRSWLQAEKERRGTDSLEWIIGEYRPSIEWYRGAISFLENSFKQSGRETASNPAWFSVTASKRSPENVATAKYKVYDTLDIRDYGKIAELPKLVEKLAVLGKETGESIKIKIPGNFSGFITHNDSIVIHCDNRETCNKALHAIVEWKSEQGLKEAPRELNRTTIALDGKISKDGKVNSFSQLVSEHVAKWLNEHAGDYPPETLATEAIKHAIAFSQKEPTPPK